MIEILKTKVLKEVQIKVNGWHGIDSGEHLALEIDGKEVEIYPPARDDLGYILQWRVVWNGGLEFEGNKKDMLKRYPEFKVLNHSHI